MSDELQPGDLVECINVQPARGEPKAFMLRIGAIYRVEIVGVAQDEFCVGLTVFPVETKPGFFWGFRAHRFRKLTKADRAFTAQMRALRPHKAGARA